VTAASVLAAAGASIANGTAGVSITAGQQIYKDVNGLMQLVKADTNAHSQTTGVALNNAGANQPVSFITGGNYNPGATVTVGTIYIASPNNAGGIAPITDATTGTYMTVLGIATTASNILVQPWVTSVNHA
jgi:hypothetical protein